MGAQGLKEAKSFTPDTRALKKAAQRTVEVTRSLAKEANPTTTDAPIKDIREALVEAAQFPQGPPPEKTEENFDEKSKEPLKRKKLSSTASQSGPEQGKATDDWSERSVCSKQTISLISDERLKPGTNEPKRRQLKQMEKQQ